VGDKSVAASIDRSRFPFGSNIVCNLSNRATSDIEAQPTLTDMTSLPPPSTMAVMGGLLWMLSQLYSAGMEGTHPSWKEAPVMAEFSIVICGWVGG
jgi:hypothetical protein